MGIPTRLQSILESLQGLKDGIDPTQRASRNRESAIESLLESIMPDRILDLWCSYAILAGWESNMELYRTV